MSGLGLEQSAQFVTQARKAGGEAPGADAPRSNETPRLVGSGSLLSPWLVRDLVSTSTSPSSSLPDGFGDLPRKERSEILNTARRRVDDSARRIARLIDVLLPALEATLEEPEPDVAQFGEQRRTVVSFAASLPVISFPLLPQVEVLNRDRLVVQGIGSSNRVADAGEFSGLDTPEQVVRARLRIDHERNETLRRVQDRFNRTLSLIDHWITRDAQRAPDADKPEAARTARLTFSDSDSRSFHAHYQQQGQGRLITATGVGSYDQGVRIVGQTFHFGGPRGQGGSKSI